MLPCRPFFQQARRRWHRGPIAGEAKPIDCGRAPPRREVRCSYSTPAGRLGRVGVDAGVADALARDEVLDVEEVVLGALGDREQRVHRRDLLDLLLEEPEHGLLAERITLGPGGLEQRLDLPGDLLLLREGELDRLDDVREVVAHGRDAGDRDAEMPVHAVLHEHHRVIALLDRLPVEVRRELRQVVIVEPRRDRDVLLRCRESLPIWVTGGR